jgi:hypothetical protein
MKMVLVAFFESDLFVVKYYVAPGENFQGQIMGGFEGGDSNFWTNILVGSVNWLAPIGGTIIEVRSILQLQE